MALNVISVIISAYEILAKKILKFKIRLRKCF